MTLPTLYKRDSKGKVRQWEVWTDDKFVNVRYGLQTGKLAIKITESKSKNVGRANETTPAEQAVLEAQSKWNFQVNREDYHEDVELAGRQIRPMLALDYLKVPHRLDWIRAMAQPKLDGLRLTSGKRYVDEPGFELMTRKGEIYKVHHFTDPSIKLLEMINETLSTGEFSNDNFECLALDGEAYLHGLPLGKITSLARKYVKGKTEQLEYHLFDLVIPDMGFKERYDVLAAALWDYAITYNKMGNREALADNPFKLVTLHEVTNEDHATLLQGEFMEMGYEGVILRHFDSQYRIAGRSPDLFKFKEFMDDECKIEKMWEDKDGNAMLGVRQKNGEYCEVTPKRTHEFRKQMLTEQDEWIGKWINVKFQNYTEYDIMQFPVGRDLRECDDEGNPLL